MGKKNKNKMGRILAENSNDHRQRDELNLNDLRKRLELDDDFITSLIDTIPPKIYFDKETQDKIITEKHAVMDKAVTALRKRKGGTQELSFKTKHKRAKLDPNLQKSVSQIQQEMSNGKTKSHKKVSQPVNSKRAENIEELHEKLKGKISDLKSKRGGVYNAELHTKKRLKAKKLLEKRKARKLRAKEDCKGQATDAVANRDTEKSSELIKKAKVKPSKQSKPVQPKPLFNKEGKVLFSKFEFNEDELQEKKKGELSGKNYKKILHNLNKEKKKIDKLKEEDPSKADEFVEKISWKKAIEKAEGVKVKDDTSLLKKSLLRQRQKKRKNSRMWKERIEQTEKLKKSAQEKRKKNIQKKKDEKFQAKVKRAKKKGRAIPGY